MKTTPLVAALLWFQELNPQGSGWMQIATGGVLALLIIREVFAFLKSRQQNDGDIPSAVRGAMKQVINESLLPVLDKQTDNLRLIEHAMQRQTEILVKISAIQEADRT